MSSLLKISQQTLWQLIGKIITSASTFVILALVTRNYGEDGTGIFTLALTYLGIFYLLSDFGFNAHLLPHIQKLDLKAKQLEFRKLLGLRIIWSTFLLFIAISLLPFWPFASPDFNQGVLLASLAIVASSIYTTTNLIFQSKLRYDLSVLASSLGTLLSLAFFILFALKQAPLHLITLPHLFGWILIAFSSFILSIKIFPNLSPIFDLNYAKSLFKNAWPIAATLALNVVYFRADTFMISYFKGPSDVGIYNIAFQLFQTALVLPAFIMNSYYPLMIESMKENSHQFIKQIKIAGIILTSLAILATSLTMILAPFVILILTGGGFAGSAKSLQILSLGFPAYFASALLMWVLVVRKKYKLMLGIYTIGLIFNLTANYIYIPEYSFIASSWITISSEYLILAMQVVVLFFI